MYDLCIAVFLLTTPGEVPRQLLPRHYMPRVKLRLVDDVSGGFHLTSGSHVAKSDFDRTVHVNWTLIERPTLIWGGSFW
jgi:hypothetical protein